MRVLVTGGTGFIGTFVVLALLQAGEAPVVLDARAPRGLLADPANDVPFVEGSVEDSDLVLRAMQVHQADQVVHLASLLQFGCARDPRRAVEVNVRGTLNVLEAARRTGVRKVVFASSGAVYGPRTDPMDEDSPVLPNVSLYGATKFLGEVLLRHYRDLYGIPFVALRYGGVYGPGEVRSPGVAEVVKRIESTIDGRDVVIDEVGADDRRHFVFVKDAAQATVQALRAEHNVRGVFNIAGGADSYVSFAGFHRVIKTLHPGAGEATFTGKGQDRGRVDISLARTELGYTPHYSLEEGIREDISFLVSRAKTGGPASRML